MQGNIFEHRQPLTIGARRRHRHRRGGLGRKLVGEAELLLRLGHILDLGWSVRARGGLRSHAVQCAILARNRVVSVLLPPPPHDVEEGMERPEDWIVGCRRGATKVSADESMQWVVDIFLEVASVRRCDQEFGGWLITLFGALGTR